MSLNSDDQISSNDEELLTAYLDDELSDDVRAKLESRLAVEKDLRSQLHQLQRTWDILDELPQTELRNSFTQTTLELVVSDATRETRKKASSLWQWPFRVMIFLGVPILIGWSGWAAIHYWQDTPNRTMINNLPLIDNVDVYLKAEDVDFLTQLRDTGLFDENDEATDATLDQ